jgi:hypothetical protein
MHMSLQVLYMTLALMARPARTAHEAGATNMGAWLAEVGIVAASSNDYFVTFIEDNKMYRLHRHRQRGIKI